MSRLICLLSCFLIFGSAQPSYALLPKLLKERKMLQQAKEAEDLQNYEMAIERYQELLKLYPKRGEYYFQIGKLYSWINKGEEGEKYLNLALQYSFAKADALVAKGYIHYWKGDYKEAIALAKRAKREKANSEDALILLGRAYLALGDLEKAKKAFDKAIQIDSNQLNAHLALATIHEIKGQYAIANKAFEKLDTQYPDEALIRKGIIDTNAFANPSIQFDGIYFQEKEKDLLTDQYTTKIITGIVEAKVQIPISDRIRPLLFTKYYSDVQRNIVIHQDNFNVDHYFYGAGAEMNISTQWYFKVLGNVHFARDHNTNVYPFHDITTFEPTWQIRYLTPKHFFSFSGVVDSFVARDFDDIESYLVKRASVSSAYEWRFLPPYGALGCELEYAHLYERNSNNFYRGAIGARGKLPIDFGNWILGYTFEYRNYQKTLPDYFSFKNAFKHEGTLRYLIGQYTDTTFEMRYSYAWTSMSSLSNVAQTIVDPTIQAPQIISKRIFRANIFESEVTHYFTTRLHFTLFGKYYNDSEDYFTIGGKASLKWFF